MTERLEPLDPHNETLLSHVRPPNWVNPEPAARYNLVVIGAGTAGLVTAAGSAGLGAKVALIERNLMGGDCLNVGCVPSKAIVRSGRAAAAVRDAGRFGISTASPAVEFGAVMERMRRLRAGIAPHDSAARFRDLGVDVFLGDASFAGPDTVTVDGKTLHFAKAVIATGARASAPPIPGLDQVPYLTNETLFSLTDRPGRLGIIGAGPIGCEMAQTFARLGTEVLLVEAAEGILPREDRDAARIVHRALERDGVNVLCCGKNLHLSPSTSGIRLRVDIEGKAYDEEVDQLLIAAGRAPNVEGLGLESAGVRFDKKGVAVNDRLQTSNPRVYACGDVCSPYQFTHAADFMARIVIQNALFKGRKKVGDLIIPWATYTSPEIAHVGLYEKEAADRGIAIDTYTVEMDSVDRAILDGETEGFVRIHTRKGKDAIVGATIVAAHAGDMISEIVLAMQHKIGLGGISATIHPYPTQAEAIRRAGDLYNKTRLTPWVKALFVRWLAWTR